MVPLEQMKGSMVGRWILTEEGLERGYLRLEEDTLAEVCWGDAPVEAAKAVILPAFVNAHTHIGDTVAYPAPKGTVKEIVGPDGYKHRVLRSRSSDSKTAAMKTAVETMRSSGISLFGDFREEGVEGIRSFKNALRDGWPKALVFGRPKGPEPARGEIDALLRDCDGLGLSAISDLPYDVLKTMSRKAHAAGKLFAIHASEAARENIDSILELNPDFLVHMCKATDEDLHKCRDNGIPVVVCPSSNHFFGIDPDIPRLLRSGLNVGLGTDNGMVVRPDMFEEMRTAYSLSSTDAEVTPLEIVLLATFGGRKVLNVAAKITTEISERMELLAVRVAGDDPLDDVVKRAKSEDIVAMIRGGKVGRTSSWKT